MAVREIAVIGLGRMGRSIAEEFSAKGGQVIAVDRDERLVEEISDKVELAIRVDATNADSLKGIGLSNVDAAVVSMSDSLEASIVAVMVCKEMGVPFIVAKAKDRLQADILKQVGAHKIILPEVEIGISVAMSLLYGDYVDVVSVTDGISILEITTPQKWIGKTLIDLDLRKKYGFNVIGTKIDGKMSIDVVIDEPLTENEILVILGKDQQLAKVFMRH